jgi:hypothetical protein
MEVIVPFVRISCAHNALLGPLNRNRHVLHIIIAVYEDNQMFFANINSLIRVLEWGTINK